MQLLVTSQCICLKSCLLNLGRVVNAALHMQAVEERAEQVQGRAENVSKAAHADSPQQEAAAEVGQTVTGAAPEEDLGDTLSVLQGADSKLKGQKQPQAQVFLSLDVSHSLQLRFCSQHRCFVK